MREEEDFENPDLPVHMTGIFVEVARSNQMQKLDIAQLTEIEMEFFARNHAGAGWYFAKLLQQWIRKNVEPTE